MLVHLYGSFIFQFLLVRLKVVMLLVSTYLRTVFQFLLVRLKVDSCLSFDGFIVISIPSGAIKRLRGNWIRTLQIEFQFLLVRLKAICHSLFKRIILFQFLLVRLKETLLRVYEQHHVDFNSYWCD